MTYIKGKHIAFQFGICVIVVFILLSCVTSNHASADSPSHPDFSKVYTELFEIGYPWLDVPESRLVLETDGLEGEYQGFKDALSEFADKKDMMFYCGTHEEMKALSIYEYKDNGKWRCFKNYDGYLVRVQEHEVDKKTYSVTVSILLNAHTGVDVEAIVDVDDLSYTIVHCMVG